MNHTKILETIINPAKEVSSRALTLNQEDVLGVLCHTHTHSKIIDQTKLKGFELVMGEDNKPIIGYVNGRFGVFTRREIHPDSGLYERGIILSPFGKPNDQLWVRETWRIGAWDENTGQFAIDYKATPEIKKTDWVSVDNDPNGTKFTEYWIDISNELHDKGVKCDDDGNYNWEAGESPLKWRSPVCMPKWASRLTLDVIDVVVEPVVGSMPVQWQFTVTYSLNNQAIAQLSTDKKE